MFFFGHIMLLESSFFEDLSPVNSFSVEVSSFFSYWSFYLSNLFYCDPFWNNL